MPLLAFTPINFSSPLVWAVIVGWVLSVALHEFGHGIVAYLAGDYTIRERGGLTLNPLQYLDPLTSIVFPMIFLMMGGLPLPGGVTFVRRDLIRGRLANCAVSLAGPLVNFLLFAICALMLQPHWGPMRPPLDLHDWTPAQLFMASMAYLQFLVCILNLLPVPPLDGFQALSFFLPGDMRMRLMNPRYRMFTLVALFMILSSWPEFWDTISRWLFNLLRLAGFSPMNALDVFGAFERAMFNR